MRYNILVKKALFIIGPTAVGKTDLAFKISQKIPSALISADSVQVYKGLDIISGKDLPKDVKFVSDHYEINSLYIYLLSAVSPFEPFSVYDFAKKAEKILDKIHEDKKIPIIVGGAGFYVNSLIKGIETLKIPPDTQLRQKLLNFSVEKLQEELKKINSSKFESMNISDINNPRRLVRAIEVSFFEGRARTNRPYFKQNEVLMIGLTADMNTIREKIRERVEKRIRQGALAEAKSLFADYEKLSDQVKSLSGYRQLFDYLLGKISFEEAKVRWIKSEIHLAKKQITWFKRNEDIIWFDIENKGFKDKILRLIFAKFPTVPLSSRLDNGTGQ